jgi:tetratricopeptide (TPR) repeat protein
MSLNAKSSECPDFFWFFAFKRILATPQRNPFVMSGWSAYCVHRFDVLPGEGHVPYTSYRDALLALFPDFQMSEEDLAHGIKAIDEHYRALTQRYGFKIEAPADPMVEYGELMLEQNDHEKAIEALEIAASRYPENVPSYYRLGQAYEAADRLPEALATYKRFLELYPQSSTIKVKVADLEKTVGQQGTEE